jgi:hypothetical protein
MAPLYESVSDLTTQPRAVAWVAIRLGGSRPVQVSCDCARHVSQDGICATRPVGGDTDALWRRTMAAGKTHGTSDSPLRIFACAWDEVTGRSCGPGPRIDVPTYEQAGIGQLAWLAGTATREASTNRRTDRVSGLTAGDVNPSGRACEVQPAVAVRGPCKSSPSNIRTAAQTNGSAPVSIRHCSFTSA